MEQPTKELRQRRTATEPSTIGTDDDLSVATTFSCSDPSPSNAKNRSPVPSTIGEWDIIKERHDLFNLVALLPMNLFLILNWDWELLFQGNGLDVVWTGNYFWSYYFYTLSYFLVDTIFVWLQPECVKSPKTIIRHHLLAMSYISLAAPSRFVPYRWFMGACLSVEVNTWFLIARRVVFKRSDMLHPIIVETVPVLFYVSWILIRCILYPSIFGVQLYLLKMEYDETGTIFHLPAICIPMHFFLCALNLKWSYELFLPPIKKFIRGDDGANREISSGL
mmetsp:Transcript_34935/g.53573  ORF Transcript_34935/g.53573 Transcript_34935/m.53573 type:complete len:278 (+) Transcript_34935:243-1076(+)|eukprot:CAMPEP_0118702624 /NCGR_PEP_ID=MMETSP0800-20121206/17999_1 /TAXON_ID=210618 ORGANISM="Striatella unipunctata, Strain CCMP2910" /NCGR_SAMPLE_ID=MMETSP0800 /ASSEMBLY_ACC=CAM_ASM_000638 /LENGTH=277 /DNA_ID=CAMNT_0006603855 /DNA_START=224 /DNA_END=1057 /DNA_ORIENTATION=+